MLSSGSGIGRKTWEEAERGETGGKQGNTRAHHPEELSLVIQRAMDDSIEEFTKVYQVCVRKPPSCALSPQFPLYFTCHHHKLDDC